MMRYDTEHNKTGSSSDREREAVVQIEKQDGSTESLWCVDHFWSEDHSLLHLYMGERSDGIDLSVPAGRVVAVCRSCRGRRNAGVEPTHDLDEPEGAPYPHPYVLDDGDKGGSEA